MSVLLQCMLVPDDAGQVPVFPDAVESLDAIFRQALARHGTRAVAEPTPPGPAADRPAVVRAAFDAADDALATALEMALAVRSPARQPPVPMPLRMALDLDALGPAALWRERFAACEAMCLAAHDGQAVATEAVAFAATAALAPAWLEPLAPARLSDLAPSRTLFQLSHPDLPGAFPPVRSLDAVPNNLPPQHTHFVGRVRERHDVALLLVLYRLVTIVGGGGIGKTRLALQVAAEEAPRFPDGIWLVELTGARQAVRVAAEIAASIGLEDAGADPLGMIAVRLGGRRCLLILDNCEADPDAAAAVAAALVAACPGLHVLATSRRTLDHPPEHPLVLSPMPSGPDVATGEPSDAARLFVDRVLARAQGDAPELDAALVEPLCALLEGNPLAIELAAARMRTWDLATLYRRIARRFDALGENPSAPHPRQRSLWATIDWSYQLLSPGAQRVFEAFSTFEGGAELDAVRCVVADDGPSEDVPAALDELAAVFLLERRDADGTPRWEMLATLRAFAAERLAETGPERPAELAAHHARWFAQLAVASLERINGPEQAATVRRLAREHRNLRNALAWLSLQPDIDEGLRMGVSLRRYWACAGHFGEGRDHLESLLRSAAAADPRLRASALYSLATLAVRQSDFARARSCLDEALAIAEAEDDGNLVGKVRNAYGNLAMQTGDVATARAQFAAALARMQELEHEVGIIAALNNLAMVETTVGNLAAATEHFETCLTLAREIGYARGIADALNNLAIVLGMRSDYRRTRRLLAECVSILQQIGERRRFALAMANLGHAAMRQGRTEDARSLCLQALSIQEVLGDQNGAAQTQLCLGLTALFEDDLDAAPAHLASAAEAIARLDERHADEAEVVLAQGEVARRLGDLDAATGLAQEGLSIAETAGNLRQIGLAHLTLARVDLDGHRVDAARASLLRGLEVLARLGNRRGVAEAAEGLAALVSPEEAAQLTGAASAERAAIGAPPSGDEVRRLGALRARLAEALTPAGLAEAEARGAAIGLDALTARALADAQPPTTISVPSSERSSR